jgi:hypothetical protein
MRKFHRFGMGYRSALGRPRRAWNLDPADSVVYARQHSRRNWTERFVSLLEPSPHLGTVSHPMAAEKGCGKPWTLVIKASRSIGPPT